MNKDLNKRGRGGPQKKGSKDLGRNTYIEKIIVKSKAESSSRATVNIRTRTQFEGQSVEQLILPTGVRISLSMTDGEEVESKASDKIELLPLVVEEEEVASRGSEKETNPSTPVEGNLGEFT